MKLTRSILAIVLSLSLTVFSFLSLSIQPTFAQDAKIAIQRGYRTGYSDGYMSGYRDAIENSSKNYARHNEYNKADRAYNKDYGVLEEYRDGYQQGFESGYDTGFEKRSFDATLPLELKKRGARTLPIVEKPAVEENIPEKNVAEVKPEITENVSESTISGSNTEINNQTPITQNRVEEITYRNETDAVIIIPTDTEIIIELIDHLSTERNREGDKFKARIISPTEISGAVIEGRISKIRKAGRIKRRSEMLLSFDRIVLNEKRWSNFNATLTEVLPVRGDNVKLVDTEGTAVGKRNVKEDSVKVGAATGTGLVIGAIAGGPVGAAVGASVGAAFGVGAVVIERGKNINLNRNQQLRIKTAYETQIR
jgi:flagellar biosynthesis/type III secretory pathway protein FliH